jgi:prepilin-type N-terminal cleavage/methylation domain-containing protein
MTSRTSRARSAEGFTLIELILVMALLVVVMAVVSPSLRGFLQGRTLDSEVRRFVSLTHYAQARAVNEGIAMRLWVDPERRQYGLAGEYSMDASGVDPKSVVYEMGQDLQVDVEQRSWAILMGNRMALQNRWAGGQPSSGTNIGQFVFRFTPDGFIDDTSPLGLWIRHLPAGTSTRARPLPGDEVYVGQSLNRLRYEVQTNQLATIVR